MALLFCIVAPAWGATTYYVSTNYGDDLCDGTVDQPRGGCTVNCSCATETIFAALSLNLVPGDIVKVDSGNYEEAVDITQAGITLEGKDAWNPPVILGNPSTYHVLDHEGWEEDGVLYRTTDSIFTSNVRAAYILDGPTDYENGRVALIPYHLLSHLSSPNTAFDDDGYYAGPGIIRQPDSKLYIRLDTTPQLTSYETKVMPVFTRGRSPNDYRIAVTLNTNYTVRIGAQNVTIRYLQIEPAREAVKVAASNVTIDSVTIWGPSEGMGVSNHGDSASNVTIKNSRIYHDIGYWIAWTDCKTDVVPNMVPPVCTRMRPAGVGIFKTASDWTIHGNHIRGFHDGIATNDFNAFSDESFHRIIIAYNRIESIHDDAIEIEANTVTETMGMVEIYGNYIGNALTCASFGQESPGTWTGPIHFLSNVCVDIRPHHFNRTFGNANQTSNAGDGLRYGHEAAMKWGHNVDDDPDGPEDLNTNVYNNTFVLHDSNRFRGLALTNRADNQGGDRFFNNLLIAVNGRVGEFTYHAGPEIVNHNLYYTFNNPTNLPLLDTFKNVAECCASALCQGRECEGLGSVDYKGTDPDLNTLGFGCIASGKCTSWGTETAEWGTDAGIMENGNVASHHLQTYPPSWIWDPSMFIPRSGSLVCTQGIGSLPEDPVPPSRPPVDPSFSEVSFSASTIGAIPCGTFPSQFDYFPINQTWKTTNLITNTAPTASVLSPVPTTTSICQNDAVNLCGTFTEPDGAPPFSFYWDFCPAPASCGPDAPPNSTADCPGNTTFANLGTYTVSYTVKDRWGKQSAPVTRTIVVNDCAPPPGGGGGGCSNCSHCICNVEN